MGRGRRYLKLVGHSALLSPLVGIFTYIQYQDNWVKLRDGALSRWYLLGVLLVYIFCPVILGMALGSVVKGIGARAQDREARCLKLLYKWLTRSLLLPQHQAPRAWDYRFGAIGESEGGWVRIRLRTGIWIAGVSGSVDGKYAQFASYPEERLDMFFPKMVAVNPETGEFRRGEDGKPKILDKELLVSWESIEYIEFLEG